jgi:hypothetical protein
MPAFRTGAPKQGSHSGSACFSYGLLAFVVALALHAQLALRALSLSLIFIFLPVIALRVFAAYDLLRRAPSKHAPPRIPDAELPV